MYFDSFMAHHNICHATGMEETPKVALDIQCLWQGGRVALTLTTNKFLHREVMAAHGLLWLEQAKQIKQMIPLPLKQTQALEKASSTTARNRSQTRALVSEQGATKCLEL